MYILNVHNLDDYNLRAMGTFFIILLLLIFFKPIFHCDAKLFALGTFALPNAKNTNMLVSLALGDANFLRWPCTFLFFLRYPRRQPLTPRKIFALGMYISCCLCQFHLRRAPNANSFLSGIWAQLPATSAPSRNLHHWTLYKNLLFDASRTWT